MVWYLAVPVYNCHLLLQGIDYHELDPNLTMTDMPEEDMMRDLHRVLQFWHMLYLVLCQPLIELFLLRIMPVLVVAISYDSPLAQDQTRLICTKTTRRK